MKMRPRGHTSRNQAPSLPQVLSKVVTVGCGVRIEKEGARRLPTYKEGGGPAGEQPACDHCSLICLLSTHGVPGSELLCSELGRQRFRSSSQALGGSRCVGKLDTMCWLLGAGGTDKGELSLTHYLQSSSLQTFLVPQKKLESRH